MAVRHIIISLILLLPAVGYGSRQRSISLDEAIATARAGSVDAAVALDKLRSAYWQWRSYRAALLPEVNFTAKAPDYFKQYSTYQNADGTYSFVPNNYISLSGELSVSQNIWLTGGTLTLSSSLEYLRQLDGTPYNRFMAIPVALTLRQPIFAANHVRWNRRIEPVRYAEAKAEFLSATEEVAMGAVSRFFNLLLAKEELATAEQNLEYADRLYNVAVEKRRMGSISENDLLQMELNLLDARSSLTDAGSNFKNAMFVFKSFLGIDDDVDLVPLQPDSVPGTELVYADVLDKALTNNKFAKNLRRRQLEADYAVAQAKGEMRQIDLFAQVGFTGTGSELRNGYDPLKDNQVVQVGFSIPLLDWGKRRGKVRVAESRRRVTESQLRLESQNFSQDIFILVERFNNQRRQLGIAQRADEIARQRYATNVETFVIGRISTLDLGDSQQRKDSARRRLINELYLFWNYYYQLRSLTLWDYAGNCGIDADIDAILRQH